MTLSDLEHAVMSPVRFTTLLRRHAEDALNPYNKCFPCITRTLPYQLPGISDPVPEISAIYLVPGGRFLLTVNTAFAMSLWDLGYNAHSSINALPVASIVLEHAVASFEVQPIGDGQGIRIFVISIAPPFTLLKVMEIYPTSSSASFSQITSCSLPYPLMSYTLNNDLVAYHYSDHIRVFDFISNMTVAWTVIQRDFSDIFLFEDAVLLLQPKDLHTQFSLWRVPALRPVLDDPKMLRYNDKFFSLTSPNQYCAPSSQSAWFRSCPDYTQHIDLIGIANNGSCGVARYILKHINRCGDLSLPSMIPILSSQFLICDSDRPNWVREFDSTCLWDGSALLLWVEDEALVANLSEISPTSSEIVASPSSQMNNLRDDDWPWGSGKSTSVILCDSIKQRRKGAVAHCQMSGRLCVLSSNEIHIMDYLVPSA